MSKGSFPGRSTDRPIRRGTVPKYIRAATGDGVHALTPEHGPDMVPFAARIP
jgi:hypothetical protein